MTKLKDKVYLSDLTNIVDILKPKKHILLLSHMRSYTSLFGHLIGEHPSVDGYYEMHIGYYSNKSLLRQKILYYRDNAAKKANYMFDKVLHCEHEIAESMLKQLGDNVLISLRHPSTAIASIQEYYTKKHPKHEFSNFKNAEAYYLRRLMTLQMQSETIKGRFLYFDSETLVNDSSRLLSSVQKFIGLQGAIPNTYAPRAQTGAKNTGDTSTTLSEGKIMPRIERNHAENVQQSTLELYEEARNLLLSNALITVQNNE